MVAGPAPGLVRGVQDRQPSATRQPAGTGRHEHQIGSDTPSLGRNFQKTGAVLDPEFVVGVAGQYAVSVSDESPDEG
jgi:hypothetical protein